MHPVKQKKKASFIAHFLIGLFLLSFSLSPLSYATDAPLSDIVSHWAEPFIIEVAKNNVVSGFPDGTFRPNDTVNRDQFIRMVMSARNKNIRSAEKNEYWAAPYIEEALKLNVISSDYFGTLTPSNYALPISREEMASVLVKTYRLDFPSPSASQIQVASSKLTDFNTVNTLFLDDVITAVSLDYINGLPDKTFAPRKEASRAEAAKVLYIHLSKTGTLNASKDQPKSDYTVLDLPLGATQNQVIEKLGEPLRKDVSAYGFSWWIYHNQYSDYTALGLSEGKLVGYFTLSSKFTLPKTVTLGQNKADINQILGSPLQSLIKSDGEYELENSPYIATYKQGAYFVKTHFDAIDGGKLFAVQVLPQDFEQKIKGYYGTPSLLLRNAYEMQIFDLANAFRVQNGVKPYLYAKDAAEVAYGHSVDMAKRNFFDHVTPDDKTPAHRFKSAGLSPSVVSENIAAGYINGFDAHTGWINSKGHRENLLRPMTYLGVGVYFGGNYGTYYTQNMYDK